MTDQIMDDWDNYVVQRFRGMWDKLSERSQQAAIAYYPELAELPPAAPNPTERRQHP